jgi:hypothetical protein
MIALHRLTVDSFADRPHHDFRVFAQNCRGIDGAPAPLAGAISSAARLEERTRLTW